MTFRAKPVAKRNQKHSWESRDRRNTYVNLGFGLVIVTAVAILLIAVGVSYYSDNLASVGSVDGQSISKAELRDRAKIENWRLDEAVARIRTLTVAGRLTEAEATTQQQIIDQQRQQLAAISLERLIDNKLQATLAGQQGISVTDADIDARLKEEATTPAARHAWVIEVAPEVGAGAGEPTAAQIAAAKAKAEAALKDLQGGKAWEDVAKTVSTDASTAPQGGDLGWIQEDDPQLDPEFLAAIDKAEANTPTAVIQGDDGTFRIGRVTEIAAASVDAAYTDKIVNDGVDLKQYREVIRGDVIRQKLEDAVVGDLLKAGPQREASEIYLAQSTLDLPADAVKVRHILFSPNDDPSGASNGDIPETDPGWAKAQADALAAYAQLQADPSKFDELARTLSDEDSAKGPTGTGGVLSTYVSNDASYVQSFTDPILAAKAKDGQILAPFKTEFGWHIVQVLNHKPTMDQVKQRLAAGEDFAQVAKDLSDGSEASSGGQLGWVAKGQLQKELIDAIFATAVGKVSDVVTVKDDGEYLFKVTAEQERTPDASQESDIRSRAWSDWYDPKKAAATITRDESVTGSSIGG